jgi:hypothetical protein
MIFEYERKRRKDAIDFARGSVRLEGFLLDEEIERFNAEFLVGNLSSEEHSRVCQTYILIKASFAK